MIPTLPRSYDAWRTMSEDDYYKELNRESKEEDEPDYDFDFNGRE